MSKWESKPTTLEPHLRSPMGLDKSDLNGEVTVFQGAHLHGGIQFGTENRKGNGTRRNSLEVWKSLGKKGLVDMLLDLLQKIFEQEKMAEEWRDSVIVPIFKEKGGILG